MPTQPSCHFGTPRSEAGPSPEEKNDAMFINRSNELNSTRHAIPVMAIEPYTDVRSTAAFGGKPDIEPTSPHDRVWTQVGSPRLELSAHYSSLNPLRFT
jgi:hypothetical protein